MVGKRKNKLANIIWIVLSISVIIIAFLIVKNINDDDNKVSIYVVGNIDKSDVYEINDIDGVSDENNENDEDDRNNNYGFRCTRFSSFGLINTRIS